MSVARRMAEMTSGIDIARKNQNYQSKIVNWLLRLFSGLVVPDFGGGAKKNIYGKLDKVVVS